jgi:hypothetical protein
VRESFDKRTAFDTLRTTRGEGMSFRMWASTIAVVCLLAAALVAGNGAIRDRSEHSRPAARVVQGSVVITREGKLFHRAGCKYIHGQAEIVSASEAEREGYTPCTRCYHDAMVQR